MQHGKTFDTRPLVPSVNSRLDAARIDSRCFQPQEKEMDLRASNPSRAIAGNLVDAELSVPPRSLCGSAIDCVNGSIDRLATAVDSLTESLSVVLSEEPKVATGRDQVAQVPQSSLHGALLALADRIDGLTSRVSDLRSRNTL